MLLYITVGSNDLDRACLFYDAALAPLGIVRRVTEKVEIGYAVPADDRCRFWVVTPFDEKAATIGNGSMIALEAQSRADVDAFYTAGMAHGGTDEGKPGLRPYHESFYAAYLRDPDGNKISAVCEKPE
ncbi:VOC family protein [Pararhizobium sp.]|uniref:VOC family protein n=1 Tax=Pararhizobium sp. TaxID=1977563 RepID=UPI002725B170|nr:VOC family protein [Pararhizobium sp.]MDO9415570.1 VOC family protein [Pararhizobium sp.]